jgi:hypothetical protein
VIVTVLDSTPSAETVTVYVLSLLVVFAPKLRVTVLPSVLTEHPALAALAVHWRSEDTVNEAEVASASTLI